VSWGDVYCCAFPLCFVELTIISFLLFPQGYQKAIDEFREKNPDWGKGIYATVSDWFCSGLCVK
jgi:hypothetical protein